jgi:hypothetical protein
MEYVNNSVIVIIIMTIPIISLIIWRGLCIIYPELWGEDFNNNNNNNNNKSNNLIKRKKHNYFR